MKKFIVLSYMLGLPTLVALIDYAVIYGDTFYKSTLFGCALIVLNMVALGTFVMAIASMPNSTRNKGKWHVDKIPAFGFCLILPIDKDKQIGVMLPFIVITYSLK